jgi:hypothetical protein
MDVKCQCGAVQFKTTSDKPIALYHCHCLECRKQSASAFGTSAIFTSEGLVPLPEDLEEKLGVYIQHSEETGGMKECYFCKNCGVRVMHRARDKDGSERGTVAIKGGCVEGLDWKGGIHIFTRSAVVPIPEGAQQFEAGPS